MHFYTIFISTAIDYNIIMRVGTRNVTIRLKYIKHDFFSKL